MFPLEHREDEQLIFHDLPIIAEQDFSMDDAFLESPKPATKKRKRASKSDEREKKLEGEREGEQKKMIHRDIERQRRQEMSNLYASLRDLLPLEYIKGRRSISDHMHEAANYIKHMERNIKELNLRREKLKNVCSSGSENGSSNGVNFRNFVTVNCGVDGVEILINCGIKEGYGCGFGLSRILDEVIHTGLDVISCISNRVNGRFLYKILAQVNPVAYINLPELQHRLGDVINKDCVDILGVDFD